MTDPAVRVQAIRDEAAGQDRFGSFSRDTVMFLLGRIDQQAQQIARLAAGWQDIATAPKDGTEVMLFREMEPWRVMGHGAWFQHGKVGGWIARGFHEPPGELGLAHPTHWMPLPDPPAARPAEGEREK